MKEFKSPGAFQSAPLVPPPGDLKENPDIKWVSEGVLPFYLCPLNFW